MAKKKTTQSSRTAASSRRSGKKTIKKKTAAKKPTRKKAATKKKATKKKDATKKSTKKKPAKKPTKKKVTKKKAATKKPTRKKTSKKTTAKKSLTKNASTRKPTAQSPAAKADSLDEAMQKEWTVAQLKRVKTGLKKKDLNEYLKLLLEKRAEIIGNVRGMEDARNASLGDIAHMPLHMADVGSDNFEQEFTLGLMESEREMLSEIEEAIVRMREGYYGVCVESGKPIGRMRLEFAPWAKYCIEVARERDRHRR